MSIDVTIERPLVTVDVDNYTVTAVAEQVSVAVTPGTEIVVTDPVTYTHDQAIPSATWIIAHNLGRYPSVTVVNSAGDTIIAKPQYIDADNIVITFAGAFAGKAYLN